MRTRKTVTRIEIRVVPDGGELAIGPGVRGYPEDGNRRAVGRNQPRREAGLGDDDTVAGFFFTGLSFSRAALTSCLNALIFSVVSTSSLLLSMGPTQNVMAAATTTKMTRWILQTMGPIWHHCCLYLEQGWYLIERQRQQS